MLNPVSRNPSFLPSCQSMEIKKELNDILELEKTDPQAAFDECSERAKTDPIAKYLCAMMIIGKEDSSAQEYELAKSYLEQAIEQGKKGSSSELVSAACIGLCQLYLYGLGTEINFETAYQCIQTAHMYNSKNGDSSYWYGCYYLEKYTPILLLRNNGEFPAEELDEKIAEMTDFRNRMYINFREATSMGHPKAAYALSKHFQLEDAEHLHCLKLAIEKANLAGAWRDLAVAYDRGLYGLQQDKAKAFFHYEKANKLGKDVNQRVFKRLCKINMDNEVAMT